MASKKFSLLCFLGLHDWRHTSAQYATEHEERLALTTQPARRVCRCCRKRQVEDVHCLGLNPPEYYSRWLNARPQ